MHFEMASDASNITDLIKHLAAKKLPIKLPSDGAEWERYTATYNARLPTYQPAVAVVPEQVEHIQEAVRAARAHGVKVQARSGGHSYASFSSGGQDGSMVIDLEGCQEVVLLPSQEGETVVVKVGAGARLGNIDLAIYDQQRRAFAHGTSPDVGAGGHFTHGGYGHSCRAWGLALDQIVAMDVVLADGTLVRASPEENENVYFVMRGAAESFGIVVNFYLRTQPAPEHVVNWSFEFDLALEGDGSPGMADAVATFLHLQAFAQDEAVVDRNLSFGLTLGGGGSPAPAQKTMSTCVLRVAGVYMGQPASRFDEAVVPRMLAGLPLPPARRSIQQVGWIESLAILSGGQAGGDGGGREELATRRVARDLPAGRHAFFAKSVATASLLTAETVASYLSFVRDEGGPGTPVAWFSIFNLYGGADSQINAAGKRKDNQDGKCRDDEFPSAYACHDSFWVVQNYGSAPTPEPMSPSFPAGGIAFVQGLNDSLTSRMAPGSYRAYLNYVDPSLSPDEAHALYFGGRLYEKLAALKDKLDPDNVFANPHSVGRGLQ